MKTIKSEWADRFMEGHGGQALLNIIFNTDFSQINNFLYLKALVLLYKVLRFLYLA